MFIVAIYRLLTRGGGTPVEPFYENSCFFGFEFDVFGIPVKPFQENSCFGFDCDVFTSSVFVVEAEVRDILPPIPLLQA